MAILSPDPWSEETKSPLALLVELKHRASQELLGEIHRLAWNFSHCPTVITIEPDLVRVWSCCEAPSNESVESHLVHLVSATDILSTHSLQKKAARALHWLNLVSGHFFIEHKERFARDGRADRSLLRNLRFFRNELRAKGLTNDDVCHDLLARVIFVQFLFHRKDGEGVAALDEEQLDEFYRQGVLCQRYRRLEEILSHYEDSYRLFYWLNERFNGDLFPGKGSTDKERALGWAAERQIVQPEHLSLLADFISGKLDGPSGQRLLWSLYSFDVIPLEFLSSIYETFINDRAALEGIYYTPPQLVDFVLDRVLPWGGLEWNLKILDPACGSGIFLVKAFQRLVKRWRNANPDQQIASETLQGLLSENLLGVDKDPHAVRVACFSLYLAMCDELEPRQYWTQVRFPSMRDERLICSDFFKEGLGFDSASGNDAYDLVIGNPPWGKHLDAEEALKWAKSQDPPWGVARLDPGVLFLAKGARLLREQGCLALMQSANSFLFNSGRLAMEFRGRLLGEYQVDEVYNFSALRFRIFKGKKETKVSESPTCLVILHGVQPDSDRPIAYISPKASSVSWGELAIDIEPDDCRWVWLEDIEHHPYIWTALIRGTQRDLHLLQRLRSYPTLGSLAKENRVRTREGIIEGNRQKIYPHLHNRRMFKARAFAESSLIYLEPQNVPKAGEVRVDRAHSTDFTAFELPQLLIKQSWQKALRRFQARLVRASPPETDGLLCSQSYVSVTGDEQILEVACLTYNSLVAAYFLQLTSGRIAAYRPEAPVGELLNVPLPRVEDLGKLDRITTREEIDEIVFAAFEMKDAERVLVEDMVSIIMSDFRGERPGLRATAKPEHSDPEETLRLYAEYFIRVLHAGFGSDKGIRASIFSTVSEKLPYRLLSFELVIGKSDLEVVTITIDTPELLTKLASFGTNDLMANRESNAAQSFPLLGRTARIYDGGGEVPTIFVLKPDALRYWTRAAALNDADEVAADLFSWTSSTIGVGVP